MISSVRRGHAPNCSASGAVVGMALLSATAAAAIVNVFADHFALWRRSEPPSEGPPEARMRRERSDTEQSTAWLALPKTAALLLLDEPAAASVPEGIARIVGLHTPAPKGAWSAPLEVHVALGSRCPVRCTSCYLGAGPDGQDADLLPLLDDIDRLAEMGVFEVALGGGETGFDERLFDVARRITERGMVANLTTSGFGLDEARAARAAKVFGQVNVSIDGGPGDYRAVRGFDGEQIGLRAVDSLVAAGARVGVNTVITSETVGALESLGAQLASRGVSEWQWLRLKPAGRAAERYDTAKLSLDQALGLWPRALQIEAATGLVLRWDCAMTPFLVAHDLPIEALARLSVEGCSGGRALLARTPEGAWAPCSFAHPESEHGSPDQIWSSGIANTTWRARAAAPDEPCASCAARTICRGGCRIVARHVRGDALAADPECPKVIACS